MNEHVRVTRPDLDLAEIQSAFDEIPLDRHFNGAYRHRTQSRFHFADGTITRLPKVDLFQSSEINKLENYGGIRREYDELPSGIEEWPSFRELVRHWAGQFGLDEFDFSAHQIRTRGSGEPVPEGRHRDGYQYVGVFVADRHKIAEDSALTNVWDINTDQKIITDVVIGAGELVSFDDRRVIHDASPLIPLDGDASHRDVLILTYPDHKEVLEHGEVRALKES